MPIDTRFPTWMLPTETPMEALFKGVAAGSQIAQNRYRNKALYAQAQEFQQQQDLRERELMAQNESRTLANEVHRTKLDHDAEDFSMMREWWPKYAASTGEELADLEPPNLHDKDRQQTVSTAITAKFGKEKQLEIAQGSAAFARAMAGGTDLTTDEGISEVYGLVGQFPFLADRIPWIERARSERVEAKQKKETADAAILARTRSLDQAQLRIEITQQDADTRFLSVEQRREAAKLTYEARLARNDPSNEFNSARIELMRARAAKLSEEVRKAPLLSPGDKAKVSALTSSLKDADEEYYAATSEKSKAKAQAKITDIEGRLSKFDPPPPTPAAPGTRDTGTPYGPPAPAAVPDRTTSSGKRIRYAGTGDVNDPSNWSYVE